MRTLKRTLNLAFLAILVVGLGLVGGGLHLAHGVQMRRNASTLLDRAHRAEADNRPADAEKALGWYLSLRPDDGPTWAWYAKVVDSHDAGRGQLERNYLVYQQALSRDESGDRALKRRAADLAMELGRHGDARNLLTELHDAAAADTTAAQRAELEDLLGQCERALGRHAEAAEWFARAIEHDSSRVDAYDRLARLRRSEMRQDAAADAAIADMIARNPRSGRAYARRWRYARELAPQADDKDITRALELAPDDREVLLTAAAAMAGEPKRDMAAVRTHLEKGHQLDPRDLDFALGLARLERSEGHLDRAEAVLRRAFDARPTPLVAFELADTMILAGKLDGEDGPGDLIDKLRRAGLGETVVRFLEAEILYQRRSWTDAVAALETARATLGAAPELTLRINLMLADCHGRLGSDEDRLDALRHAAEEKLGSETARLELVRALAQSGRLDQAIETITPLAVAGTDRRWRLDHVRLLVQKAVRQPRDRRDWAEIERQLGQAEKAMGGASEPVVLLRLDVLAAQDRLDEARALLTRSREKEPRNLGYRLALARLTQHQGRPDEALRIIDQAEKDLGPGPRIELARLDYWGQEGGDAARAAVAKLAAARAQVPAADRPAFLDRLGAVAIRLGRPDLAREYGRELASLQPENLSIRLTLFDLAVSASDRDEPTRLIEEIRKIEGEAGINWRFALAALRIDQARRGSTDALEEARRLAADIAERKPKWWVGPALDGEIAELAGSTEHAIASYLRALELGNVQPSFARRLVTLLEQQGRRAEVERVTRVLQDQGAALAEVTLVQALDALRKGDYVTALSLAKQVFPEGSANASDHLNLGKVYEAAGRRDEAGREFRRAVELGRGVPENWLTYVQHLVQTKQLDQARATIEAAGRALPPDRVTLTLARCALLVGDAARADVLIQQAMEGQGKADDLATLRVAAEAGLRLSRHDAARSYLDRIAASPAATPADLAWANRTRAALWLTTNRPADWDRSLKLVDRNLASDPANVEDQSLKAAILALRPARRGEAVAILERLAGMNRLGDDQRFLLAQLHLDQGQGAKYEDEMLGLLKHNDKNPRHLAHFVNHWIGRNQLDQADRWLAELKQADPRGQPALELEARLLDLRKRRPELLALLQARGRDVPDQIGVVAELLSRHGFAKEAEAAYTAFIAREPKQPERVLALAEFLGRQDRAPEAMEILKRAWTTCKPEQVATVALTLYDAPATGDAERKQIEVWLAEVARQRPEAVEFATKLGVLWIRQGRLDEAESLYRRILAANPGHPETLNNLAWLLVMRDQPRPDEALQLIERAVEASGPTPTLIDTRAVALIRAGRFDQAIEQLSTALPRAPRKASLPLHLAWALKAKGQREEARKEFAKAEELGLKIQSLDPYERATVQRLRAELFPR
jgi:tetratricopeptide (TPR) repeat protein